MKQKAVEENRIERERQIEMEKREQEKGISTTKQKVSKPAQLQQERQDREVDFREELKQRSNRGINVASLEERLGSTSTAKYSPRQQDFRHLLRRQTDHSSVDSNTTGSSTRAAAAAVDHHKREQLPWQQHGAGIHHRLSPSRHQERRVQTQHSKIDPNSKVGGKKDAAVSSNYQRHQQYHGQNGRGARPSPRHQDRGRVRENGDHSGAMRPGFRGGSGDRLPRSEEMEGRVEAGNGRLHGALVRDGHEQAGSWSTSQHHQHHQVGLLGHERDQGLEEDEVNYDFETQF